MNRVREDCRNLNGMAENQRVNMKDFLSTFLRCDMCMSHHYPNHQKLRILYEELEKSIKDYILNVASGAYSSEDDLKSARNKIEIYREVLDRIIYVDHDRKDMRD